MRYQERAGWCGPAALQNAFRCWGKRISQQRIARLAGSTIKDGTSAQGLIDAARALGFEAGEMCTDHAGWVEVLWDAFDGGWVPVICVEDWEHWVCVPTVMVNPERFVAIDSTREKHNKAENGVRILDEKQMNEWWRGPDDRYPKYYGITVRLK